MLMGEYDFTENFVGEETFWLSKLIFVVFVIDMSVVLMNLVIGMAVSDVDTIKKESHMQRLTHETFTVNYLEQVSSNFQEGSIQNIKFQILPVLCCIPSGGNI